MTGFTDVEELRIERIVRDRLVLAEVRRRLALRQQSDDLVQSVHDEIARLRGLGSVAGRAPDLFDELLELVGFHESSPSVGGGAPENTSPVLTVGDAADASASSPVGASAAPSGGAR